jgi:hypothetical protein
MTNPNDLIRRGDAILAAINSLHQMDAAERINRLPSHDVSALVEVAGLDCRKWWFYPIEMPLTPDGEGPAIPGRDPIGSITYEVWDRQLNSHASFDNLPDAINEALRRNATAPTPTAVDDSAEPDTGDKVAAL